MDVNDGTIRIKISRSDILNAVRNLLINEFKVLPGDVTKVVEQKLENLVKEAINEAVYKRYGFDGKVATALGAAIIKAKANLETRVEQIVKDEVKVILGGQLVEKLIEKAFGLKGQ